MRSNLMSRKSKNLEAVSKKELKKIIEAVLERNNKKGYYEFVRIRTAIMIILQFCMGLRPKEVYNAKVIHLDLDKKTYFIPSENNKERYQDIMKIPEFLIPKLYAYLEYRKRFF